METSSLLNAWTCKLEPKWLKRVSRTSKSLLRTSPKCSNWKTISISSQLLVSPFFNLLVIAYSNPYSHTEPKQKLEQLKELDMAHLRQLIKSEENTKEIEGMLTNYNEMVQKISAQIEYLDMITAQEDDIQQQSQSNEEQGTQK